jgi:hypothetical protein
MYGIVDVVYSKARRVRSLLGFKTGIDAFAAETVNETSRTCIACSTAMMARSFTSGSTTFRFMTAICRSTGIAPFAC